ncbi:hydroxyphenylacetyl-CoA thioesterase PaaI [Bradyrhizobium genosp. P]|uniref:hydroxyphenylacetyl-CoA thioesterase PaaI n=1 Tax=Bradyrhizobium genosp. P TaxID=83641 RepID=UPI003CF11E9A
MTTMTDKSAVTAEDTARAMLSGDRVSRTFGIELLEARSGGARLGMLVTREMLNGFGTCHGGVLFTLADTALSCACNSHNQRSVAHHCSIVFLRPGKLGERLVAIATERSRSGRIGIYDVSVVDEAGAVIGEFFGHAREIGGKVVNDG